MPIPWANLFAEAHPTTGAAPSDLDRLLQALAAPLAAAEVAAIEAAHSRDATYRRFDPANWPIPDRPLPASYRDFLPWSDGGSFRNGSRRFDPFLSADALREYLLAYHVPHYMPGALPFAMDGGGNFYLFDLRSDPVDGEYPIFFAPAGDLGWDDATPVARTFPDAGRGTAHPRYGA
jgi:hypothetical protein